MKSMFRKPMVLELMGFDASGVYIGSANWTWDGWRVTRFNPYTETIVTHEHKAREILRENGAIRIHESDSRKY